MCIRDSFYYNHSNKKDQINCFEEHIIAAQNTQLPLIVHTRNAEFETLEILKKKLNEKNCDWIVANDVSNKKIGFDSDFNEVSIFYKNSKPDKINYKPKSEISDELVEKIINHLN